MLFFRNITASIVFLMLLSAFAFAGAPKNSGSTPQDPQLPQIRSCAGIISPSHELPFKVEKLNEVKKNVRETKIRELIEKKRFQEASILAHRHGDLQTHQLLESYIQDLLLNDSVREVKLLKESPEAPKGVAFGTEVYIVYFHSGFKAIFKPDAQFWKSENLWPELSNPSSEIMAYEFSKAFNFGLVPVTVGREISGTFGSLQAFVTLDPPRFLTKAEVEIYRQDHFILKVFDYLITNTDRGPFTSTNFLNWNGYIIAIDHAMTFPSIYNNKEGAFNPPRVEDLVTREMDKKIYFQIKYDMSPDKIHWLFSGVDYDAGRKVLENRNRFLERFEIFFPWVPLEHPNSPQ